MSFEFVATLDPRFCVRRTRAGEVVVPVPSDDGVCVAPSRIRGAGDGLFAARPHARGALLAVYAGAPLRTLAALRLRDKAYLMRLGPQCYIDAREHAGVLARYINDACGRAWTNAEFEKRPEDAPPRALVIAARDIDAGEEIYVDYGRWYWASGRGNTPDS